MHTSHAGESEVLHTLNLSWNHIRKKGAQALAAGLKVGTVYYAKCSLVHVTVLIVCGSCRETRC